MPSPHLWIPSALARTEPVQIAGGGERFVRDDPAAHSAALRDAFNRSASTFAGRRDFDIAADLIVQITTAPEWSVARERQHLRNLGFEIVALSEDAPNVAIARISREVLPRFSKKLERYARSVKHIGKGNFAAIEAITPVGVERKIEPLLTSMPRDVEINCLISLFASLSSQIKQTIANRLAAELRGTGKTRVQIHAFANGAVGIAADLTPPEMQQIGEQWMFVRSIESNADVALESAIQADQIPSVIQVDDVRCQTAVAVIDSGVNAQCSLLNGLVLSRIVELPEGSAGPHLAHGTFVASRIVYGDEITAVLGHRARPWCPVIDVQVTGDDGLGNRKSQNAAQLGEILQRIVPALAGETRIFNLSLGIAPIATGRYSSLARLIDYLSREHQVLFVISAGNITDPGAEPPNHYLTDSARILFPAESVLALTVGSIAKYCEPNCIAESQEVAPYSRRGPGSDGALKPELVAHGGNVMWNGGAWISTPRIAVYGLGRTGTHLEYSTGTSFAAPLVSQYAARLFDAYPEATPNLVRALLCHFANPVKCPAPGTLLEPRNFGGFGEPDIDAALFARDNAAGYLFSGQIQKDHYLFIPFYIPAALADAKGSRLRIRGTVVFDPPVSVDDSVDYSFCRISGLLRKQGGDGLRDVAIGGEDDDILHPWSPIVHFGHSFRRGYAAGDWELRLRLMTRGSVPDGFAQSFSAVIEVIDEGNVVNVRDAIVHEVQAYAPVALRIAA